jgi:hypothetical protein
MAPMVPTKQKSAVRKQPPWTFVRGDGKGRPNLRCERCGDAYTLNVPVSVVIFAAVCKAFSKDHEKCQPRTLTRRVRRGT